MDTIREHGDGQAARIPSGARAPPTNRVLGEMAGRGEMWKTHVSGSKIWRKNIFQDPKCGKTMFRRKYRCFFSFWRADWLKITDSANRRSPFPRPTDRLSGQPPGARAPLGISDFSGKNPGLGHFGRNRPKVATSVPSTCGSPSPCAALRSPSRVPGPTASQRFAAHF